MKRRNAWDSKNAEIDRLKAEIDRLHERQFNQQFVAPFVADVGKSIMTMLALMPFDKWPDIAKTAFRHEADKLPAIAHHWLEQCNKED